MNITRLTFVCLLAAFSSATLPALGDAVIGNDLKATIVLQGMSCDQVVNSVHNSDSNYTVSCKNGHRYQVFVNTEGRVVVKELKT